jgi:septal ring factor EnvC (AmiA/AmiB activator)
MGLVGSDACSSHPSGSARDKIERLESELTREKEQFRKFDSKEKDLLQELAQLEREVASKRQDVETIQGRLRETRRSIEDMKQTFSTLEKRMLGVEGRLGDRLVHLYKYARRGYLNVLAGAEDLDQFRRRVKYLRSTMVADERIMAAVVQERYGLKRELAQVQEQLGGVKALEEEEMGRLSSLRSELEEKVVRLVNIHKEKEFYETAVKELESAAGGMKQTVMTLDEKSSEKPMPFSNFNAARGRLPLPMEGKIMRAERVLGASAGHLTGGILVEGSENAVVKAVFPGRVDYSDLVKGYGEVTIINHGSRFFTVYAHLARRDMQTGVMVREGDVVGLAGENRLSRRPWLYFEIRKAERRLDPFQWLNVRP